MERLSIKFIRRIYIRKIVISRQIEEEEEGEEEEETCKE